MADPHVSDEFGDREILFENLAYSVFSVNLLVTLLYGTSEEAIVWRASISSDDTEDLVSVTISPLVNLDPRLVS